jgi:NAD(P)-dependent dehydrogenase (short-subunit alcohol dehydrogenase family)
MTRALAGRVAVVTGGGRGIGRTVAEALAGAGAAVTVVARTAAEVDETAARIERAGGRALPLAADVTDREAVERLVDETEGRLGPIDLLVNSAGRAATIGPVWEVDADDWWRDVEVNLRGTFLCTRAVLRRMVPRRRGRIVNVASNLGAQPSPYNSAYAAAKAAVLRFTDGLAEATKPHDIAVFAISPGLVRTALTEHMAESDAGRRWLPQYRSAEWLPADRAGRLVLFLAAGEADELSGRFIHVADDAAGLVARAAEIKRDDLYALRVRK